MSDSDLPPHVDDDPAEGWFWDWPDTTTPSVRTRIQQWWAGR